MKAVDLQLTRLTVVSNALMGSIFSYRESKDLTGENEINKAVEELSKVIRFLTNMNEAFSEIGPDICPKCGYDLSL